jgi:putative methyltransferase (TIGR04325 family)
LITKYKKFMKDFIPPVLLRAFLRNKKNKMFSGEYSSWREALKHSTGYDDEIILKKVKSALLKVKEGSAVYERDSVLFEEIQYSWPLLAGLMWIASHSAGELDIIDYGGSLGSTYFQNRQFLKSLQRLHWNIVEQKHYVDTGKSDFENDELKFYYDLESCLKKNTSNTILFSSVLQYLEKPYELLKKIDKLGFEFILIDRTPFSNNREDRLCIQKVPPKIYDASYPAWIFSIDKFKNFFRDHEIVTEFYSIDNEPLSDFELKGFIIRFNK